MHESLGCVSFQDRKLQKSQSHALRGRRSVAHFKVADRLMIFCPVVLVEN